MLYEVITILSVPFEQRVIGNADHHVEIAGGAASGSRVPFAVQLEARTGFDAGGDFQ